MKTTKAVLRWNGTFYYIDGAAPHSVGAGFRLHEEKKVWYTPDPRIAARLREHASNKAEEALSRALLTVSPWTSPVPFPPGLKPLPFQIPAARFSLSRNRSYQYAAPGMGKTIIASLIMNGWYSEAKARFVYICPPFLVKNVENELAQWCPHIGTEHFDAPKLFGNIMIVPSSLLHRKDLQGEIFWFLNCEKVPRVLIVDEAHQFKNDESERTRRLFGHEDQPALVDLFDRVVCMSGTAMPNRPLELFPVLSKLAPETIDFMDRNQYGLKFCAGRYDGHGYDFSGSSNLEDLAKRVQGTFMYRLKKSELDLPPLTEDVFVVADEMPPELSRFEAKVLHDFSVEDLMKGKLEEKYSYQDMHLMTYQRLLGLQKVKHALDWIDDVVENSPDSMIVFARHKEVIKAIYDGAFKKGLFPVAITADVPQSHRFELVQQYLRNPKRRLLVGSLKTMGLGFNITKATRLLHVEPDWTPSTNDQGTDRAHRYGQKKPVYAQYMAYANSIDKRVLEVVLRKRKLVSYL